MKFKIEGNLIKIYDKNNFNPQHILECGQVFCYKKLNDKYIVFPQDKYCEITEKSDFYEIKVKKNEDLTYFIDFFDLETDYLSIKNHLQKFKILNQPLKFGFGIRILNQNIFETLISFIVSANNNIKRIMMILNNLRKSLGKKVKDDVYSFPSYESLLNCDVEFFKKMGAGYRAQYIYNVLRQVTPKKLENLKTLSTLELQKFLISLSGIGPKVADCIMLFAYHRMDVFPVDTWIHQMYNKYYQPLDSRIIIRKNLVDEFGDFSGYAQQYLFYFQRSYEKEEKSGDF